MFQTMFTMQQFATFFLAEGAALAFAFSFTFLYNKFNSPHACKQVLGAGTTINKMDVAPMDRSCESTDIDSESAIMSTSGSEKDTISPGLRARRSPNVKTRVSVSASTGPNCRGSKGINVEAEPCIPKVVSRSHPLTIDSTLTLQEIVKRRLQQESLQQVSGKLRPGYDDVRKELSQSKDVPRTTILRHANITQGNNTLRTNLRKLGRVDSNRVFMVRKLAKLGIESPELLKAHFSKFGVIENVYVTHAVDRRGVNPDDPKSLPTVRPAGVGFIVMKTADDIVEIFKHGLEHTVSDVVISLTAYEHHVPEDVIRNEKKLVPTHDDTDKPPGGRFPTYANITEDNTLRANLRKMSGIDANRIFMVRKIHKLGLGSSPLLKAHFGQFGGVTNVFVTHSIDRRRIDLENPNSRPLVRAGGIGFVVMDEQEDAATILQGVSEHDVYGVRICVSPYAHQTSEAVAPPQNDHEISIKEEVLIC